MVDRLQSVAENIYFQAYLSSDGKTPATGKTIAIQLSKNGGAYGNPSVGAANLTEIGNGTYYFPATSTDLNTLGPLAWLGTCTGVDNVVAIDKVLKATNRGMSALPDAALNSVGGFGQTVIAAGTAQSGSNANTLVLQTALSANNIARRAFVKIISATGAGQTAGIASHTTTSVTFDRAMAVALDTTSVYIIEYGNYPATTSAGAVPPEWSQISNPTATVGLTNTTFGTASNVAAIAAGAIDIPTLSTALIQLLTRQVTFTGTTTTIVTADVYAPAGFYGGAIYYKSTTLGTPVFLWYNGTRYIASTVLGTPGSAYFQSATASVNSAWTAQGAAGGTTSAVAHGHSQLAATQFDHTWTAKVDGNGYLQTDTEDWKGSAAPAAPPTAVQIRQEIDTNSTQLALILSDCVSILSTVGTILGKLAGITYLRQWLAMIMGSTADATTKSEINTNTTAANAYDNTTKSLQAQSGGGGGGGGIVTGFTSDALAQLAGLSIQVQLPSDVSVDQGTIEITAGDDYVTAINRAFNITFTGASLPDMSGAAHAYIAFRTSARVTRTYEMTIVSTSSTTLVIRVSLTAAQTGLFELGQGSWEPQFVTAASFKWTVVGNWILQVDEKLS